MPALPNTSPRPLISVPARVSSKSTAAAASSSSRCTRTATSSAASTAIRMRSKQAIAAMPDGLFQVGSRHRRSIPPCRGTWSSADRFAGRLPDRRIYDRGLLARMFAKATHAIAAARRSRRAPAVDAARARRDRRERDSDGRCRSSVVEQRRDTSSMCSRVSENVITSVIFLCPRRCSALLESNGYVMAAACRRVDGGSNHRRLVRLGDNRQ